jgi:hypothetical protein
MCFCSSLGTRLTGCCVPNPAYGIDTHKGSYCAVIVSEVGCLLVGVQNHLLSVHFVMHIMFLFYGRHRQI